jgi:hypothetical protein
MNELLRFLKTYEVWIYILLGFVGLIYLRKLFLALEEWRGALFGLEKDNAQRRLSEAMSILILLALMGASEFFLVSFISPTFPGIAVLPTPTLDLLATPTVTLAASGTGLSLVAAPLSTPSVAGLNQTQAPNGCKAGQIEFLFPDKPGAEIKGAVILKGTVNVPDFGFYKYEFTTPGNQSWTTIAAGNKNVTAENGGELGPWDTSQLTPGDYILRLVVTDHQGNQLPECQMPVRVSAPAP